MTPMLSYQRILLQNRDWVARTIAREPDYFEQLAQEHKPEFLWIGCSDARVPANVVTQTASGEMFVHRNIANQVVATCANTLAVLEYAVDALGVRDIIVCGHYGCGGVKAAMEGGEPLPYPHVDQWLANIRTTMRLHAEELDALRDDPERRYERLVELNVAEQVHNLGRTAVVREAWARGADLRLHGWVYKLREGVLRDLGVTLAGPAAAEPAQRQPQEEHAAHAPHASHDSNISRIARHHQHQQQQQQRQQRSPRRPADAGLTPSRAAAAGAAERVD